MALRHLKNKKYVNIVKIFGSRTYSIEQKVDVELNEAVRDDVECDRIKPQKHPGVMKIGTCSLPDNIVKAIQIVCEDHPVKPILNDAKTLTNYLFSRHYPWEEEDLRERKREFIDDVKWKMGELPSNASEEQVQHYTKILKGSVTKLMNKYNYRWSPLDLNDYFCLVYLFTRAAPNYAAVMRVFHEISKLCPDYQPKTLFDFGSGIGSVSWAAKTHWGNSLKEYMNVDSSASMNELAGLLLRNGKVEEDIPLGVYYRAFLPAQHNKYNIVVCAHSLMEMPSRDTRLKTLLNLWSKTEDFFIVIEQGTKPGFKMVLEARDFILSLSNEESPAHIFAPCPHDNACPRFLRGHYPCHFQVQYSDLPVGKTKETKKELLSYVIIKKGKRSDEEEVWPRIVRPILKRHNHVICRLCTHHGELQEIIFTKNRHGKILYKCAKKSNWGDRLPVKLPALPEKDIQPDTSQQIDTCDQLKPD